MIDPPDGDGRRLAPAEGPAKPDLSEGPVLQTYGHIVCAEADPV